MYSWTVSAVNANAAALLQHPGSLTRDEVNWATNARPPSLQLKRTGAALELRWQGGVLQTSSDLLVWSEVARPVWPMTLLPTNQPAGYWHTVE